MSRHFTSDFFSQNRKQLVTQLDADYPIVLTANGLLQKSTDTTYPFKQDGSFWYFSGVDEPNVVLIIDGDESFLIAPELSATREAFDGKVDPDDLRRTSGIKEVLHQEEGWERLRKLLKKTKRIGTLMPSDAYIDWLGMYTNPARQHLIEQIQAANTKLELVDIRQTVSRMRMVKQPVEQQAIQKAVDITLAGIDKARAGFNKQTLKTELDIELVLTKAFHEQGGSGHAFDPIVAGGAKAATIHPFGNYQDINYQGSVLLDVGAEFDHYAADISRTWAPKDNRRFNDVYQAVKDVTAYAMTQLKPGVTLREYEKLVEVRMGEELKKLGLIKTASHEAIREYFPHATSHFMGIDVHDSGDYNQSLSEGVILTVEPGIYIPKEGIGVRIEDDVLIVEGGCKNLSVKVKR